MGKKIIYRGNQRPGNLTRQQFISKIAPIIVRECINTGLLPSVLIGIAIKESDGGNDYKSFVYNNAFGLMATSSWKGDSVTGKQSGAGPYWRIYPNLEAAVQFSVKNLLQGKYKLNGVSLKKTPLAQLNALQNAGYNVGPDKKQYASVIAEKYIKPFNLQQFDSQMMAMERSVNENGLAFNQQDGITRALHSLFA